MAQNHMVVVFVPRAAAPRPRWWHRLLDPARCHVLALVRDNGVTVALEHIGTVLRVEAMALDLDEAARGLMWAWNAEALRVPMPTVPRRAALRPFLTCVELVKALTGIRSWRVWTPRQLRRALIQVGARPVSPFPEWRTR